MMRDITIGQYYPADSILHRLDPRVKFVSTLVYIVSLFVFSSWLGYGVAALFLVAMIVLSKVPFGFMIKGLKPIMVLLLITMFFNLVFTPGEVLWSFWILKITKEGIRLAIKMGIRLVFVLFAVPLFGIRGYLWGFLVSELLLAFLCCFSVRRQVEFHCNMADCVLKPGLVLLISLGLELALCTAIPVTGSFLEIVFHMGIITVCYGAFLGVILR